jgi:hypothetical protein
VSTVVEIAVGTPELSLPRSSRPARAEDVVQAICGTARFVADSDGDLEDLLGALIHLASRGRGRDVVDAERVCQVLATADPTWTPAAALLRHAVETGLFQARRPTDIG